MTNTEWLQTRLYFRIECEENIQSIYGTILKPTKPKLPGPSSLRKQEVNQQFIEYMTNRMVMGAFREEYGQLRKQKPNPQLLAWIDNRLGQYEETGNTEFLVDAANGCMIEFTYPAHPNAHFHATERP